MSRASLKFLAIVVLAIVAGIVVYPHMPAQVVSHWNAAGQPDGTMSKFWGVFLLPLMLAILLVVYLIIPRIDPLEKNIALFRGAYDAFWLGVALFMAYLYALMLFYNTGSRFDFTIALVPAMALLFWLVGWLMARSKRNWFIGIRTPWTLSDDRIWEATHRLGGTLFRVTAVLMLGALAFPRELIWFVLIPVFVAAVVPVVYSYILYRRLAQEVKPLTP